jgi:Na+-driven multidrug efflux pump
MGARQMQRVRDTFKWAAIMGSGLMFVLTLVCQWRPELFVQGFTEETAVVAVAATFLRTISWNFVASGLLFTCSGMFQALGNTVPSLISSATRLLTYAIPALWLAQRPGFQLTHVWTLSVVTVAFQALFTLWLLRRELQRRAPITA